MGRIDRVNQTIKREVGQILQRELSDPRMMLVTVTKVDVTKDLQNARIYFSVMGDQPDITNVTDALNRASGVVRRLVGQAVRMRYTPKIEFVYDDSIAYSDRIERAIQEIHDANGKSSQDD